MLWLSPQEGAMNQVVVNIPQDWINRIDGMARREDRNRSQQIRYLIRTALEQLGEDLDTPGPVRSQPVGE
jgi:metal-responsive CopG/Arc/MetJ family transcriptional regulator